MYKKTCTTETASEIVPPQCCGVNGPNSQLDSVGWAGFFNMYITAAIEVNM